LPRAQLNESAEPFVLGEFALGLGRYQCFRGGSRGNALELWTAVRQISLHAAAIELCELLRKEVPWIRHW
jgi:hypothetical protein